ncbi:MAG: Serine-tRNA ligase [Parcubacteria group bacterium GW2011_GWE2_39_37]|uniref:Serine--tRNA ligase n=1 Tax=Candidatus Falkowbacteria bacterium GW2011_GWF2_39_8 TaxID=1618642 RepID=A0A0G0PT72_9BACT|nr:MAG: Serine-tRNA ligase [Parcubacteria group bacterium GW2011_GWE2_39_37]KKR31374.1 MAG: Serine-tRNA ligase [Candidatus Falkowbacteria bacterium GW2011_GWF2_39_8]
MLDIKFIRENTKLVKKNTANRLVDVDIDRLLLLDKNRREGEAKLDLLRAERNKASKIKPTPEIIEQMKRVGDEIKKLEEETEKIEPELRQLLLKVPNLTHKKVKVSNDEDDNPVLEIFKEPTKFAFKPLDHVELAEKHDLIDFDRATKVTGAKFYYYKNELALLEFALIQYVLDILVKKGFTPFVTPDLAKKEVLEGLGFNPRGESTQVYNIENTDLSLIGTAEITMGGYHMNEILDEKELPKKYVAVSHCFRTEAGAYSKFSKGTFRVHQFTKIEMFVYCRPEESEKLHKELLNLEKKIWKGLDIPFRVVDHCTADLGGPSYRTFDLEAWMPGKPNKNGELGDWAEITSTSNCTDYQARGLNIKYRNSDGEKKFVHMLNGTAIAISRAPIAIIENYQQADGSIVIPKVLQKYLPGKIKIIKNN